MKAFVEVLSGVVRSGPNCEKYGDPYEFAVAFSVVDGKTAIIKALVVGENTVALRKDHVRALIEAMRGIGLSVDWERVKHEN